MKSPLLLPVLVGISLLATPALAEKKASHRDTAYRYSLSAPDSFRFTKGESLLGSYAGPGKVRMSLSRIGFPALGAWRRSERQAFVETVVAGARDATTEFRIKAKQSQRVEGVPALDLHFSRKGAQGPELVWMRFLFYRRYSIVASASTPGAASQGQRRRAQDFTRSLAPLRTRSK